MVKKIAIFYIGILIISLVHFELNKYFGQQKEPIESQLFGLQVITGVILTTQVRWKDVEDSETDG